MNVTELIARIVAVYPGATVEAMKTFKPVYQARLQRHEGVRLREASDTVLATFKAKFGQPFPIPADFEAHLPNLSRDMPSNGPKLDVKGHRERKVQMVEQWRAVQGERIKAERGAAIAWSCEFMAAKLADVRAWSDRPDRIILTAEQIQIAEDQVVSSERMAAHGPSALRREDPGMWQDQMDATRASVRAGDSPAKARAARDEATPRQSEATTKKLAELAAAKRRAA